MQQDGIMVANVMPALPPPPPTLRVRPKGQNSTFLELSNVAYHNKWNLECNNMVANIFMQTPPPPLPPPTLVVGSKGQHSFFQNMVMLHIKLKLVTHVATWKQIFYPHPPPLDPRSGITRSKNQLFSEHGHVAYQINWNQECIVFCPYTPTLGWGQKVKCKCFRIWSCCISN